MKLSAMNNVSGLAAAISLGPNATCLRKLVASGWLKLARQKITRQRVVDSWIRRRDPNRKRKMFLLWATYTQVRINSHANAKFLARVRTHSAMLVRIFNGWSRQTWAEGVERGVCAKVESLEQLARKQQQVWELRVTELKGAVRHAKSRAPDSKRDSATWRPRDVRCALRGGFYRGPHPKV